MRGPSRTARAKTRDARVSLASADPRSVAQLWNAIESLLAERLPAIDLKLRPGATEREIEEAELTLGVRFPDDYRASLALHDGQELDDDDDGAVAWLPGAEWLGSLASLVRCWQQDRPSIDAAMLAERSEWLDRSGRVRQAHFHPRQIPIAGSRFWDYGRLLIDLAPGPNGTEGQVIARDDIELTWLAPSFRVLLAMIARDLEDGTLRPTRVGE